MGFFRILILTFVIIGASGFDLKKDIGLYSSKTEAFEECEEWKDAGIEIINTTNINIGEEASRFSLENLTPSPHSSGSSIDQLKHADSLYEWNQSVENFLAKYPAKTMKVYSRICEYEPIKQLFVGYENKRIQEGASKDEKGMRGRMVEVKYFRY